MTGRPVVMTTVTAIARRTGESKRTISSAIGHSLTALNALRHQKRGVTADFSTMIAVAPAAFANSTTCNRTSVLARPIHRSGSPLYGAAPRFRRVLVATLH